MLIEKNAHLDAAFALLGNKTQAQSLLRSLESRPKNSFQFITQTTENPSCAVLLLTNPGSTTTFLTTSPTNTRDMATCTTLIKEGVRWLSETPIHLAQTVMPQGEPYLKQAFEEASFEHLAVLTCMEQTKKPKQRKIPNNLRFIQITSKDDKRLGDLLLETYIDSLDCPKIHGLRPINEIIAGHRGYHEQETQVWTIAELEGIPTGVVLLNPTHSPSCLELAYIGILKSARGSGLGHHLMQHVANQATSAGASRITLAVDSKNTPAIKLYNKWHFKKTKYLCTMIHKLS